MAISLPANDGSVGAVPRRAVVVFAHTPEEERHKKPFQLSPRASGDRHRIEALHQALIDRALCAAAGVAAADVFLVTTGDLERALANASSYVPTERLYVSAQVGPSFGARLEHAVQQTFAIGYQQVVVIGSDTPEFDSSRLASAFAALDGAGAEAAGPAAVVGLATDGGYYLLGLSRFTRAAFSAIPFGGPGVAALTMAALLGAGFALTTLAPLSDVDNAADLLALSRRLRRSGRPSDTALLLVLLCVLRRGASLLLLPEAPPMPGCPRGTFRARGPPVCPIY